MDNSRNPWLERRDLTDENELRGTLTYLLHDVDRLVVSAYDAAIESYNLTRAQWWALMHLDQEHGISQAEFARQVQLQPAAAGQLLKRLEAKGWVERRASAHDERVKLVYLLPAFQEVAAQLTLTGKRASSLLFANIPRHDVEIAVNVLMQIRENVLREVVDAPPIGLAAADK